MYCAIIGDRDIPPRLVGRLEMEIERLAEAYVHVHFLTGDMCGFERAAAELLDRLCRTNRRVSYSIISRENLPPNALTGKYRRNQRSLWMLSQSDAAILYLRDNSLPPESIRRIPITDLAKN